MSPGDQLPRYWWICKKIRSLCFTRKDFGYMSHCRVEKRYETQYCLLNKKHPARKGLKAEIDQIHKSHNAPVPYPTMHHSEQKCAHFCSEWCIVGYGTGALWDLKDWSIDPVGKHVEGILPKGPYPTCWRMSDRALLAGYPGCMSCIRGINSKGPFYWQRLEQG